MQIKDKSARKINFKQFEAGLALIVRPPPPHSASDLTPLFKGMYSMRYVLWCLPTWHTQRCLASGTSSTARCWWHWYMQSCHAACKFANCGSSKASREAGKGVPGSKVVRHAG